MNSQHEDFECVNGIINIFNEVMFLQEENLLNEAEPEVNP